MKFVFHLEFVMEASFRMWIIDYHLKKNMWKNNVPLFQSILDIFRKKILHGQ